jgi:site-specific DNA recombinase
MNTPTPRKRGVLYLRVSSPSQVGTDYDPEGLSIPAQRNVCRSRAEQLGIEIIDEYVELGKTGTSVAKRPQFLEMIRRLKEERDVEYVLVYKLSRLNRNRIDDALVLVQLRAVHVNLISATENIDETPEGQLMHGVLASFNEYRSAADGADIRVKMKRKAQQGGTVSRAPLGYLNTRDVLENRTVSSVSLDPDRAPLVRKAFELYATGEYTIERLQVTMADLGLRPRPTRRHGDIEVSISKLHQMLNNPYYMGQLVYQDEVYAGRHEPIVSPELFSRVQDVLTARSRMGKRDRVHFHYLKGMLYCARCLAVGRRSHLVYNQAKGVGGTYAYYLCRGRQEGLCDLPYLPVPAVERAVLDHYKTIRMPNGFAERAQEELHDAAAEIQQDTTELNAALSRRIAELDEKEERLLDLAADGELPQAKIRSRLRTLSEQRIRIEQDRAQADEKVRLGEEVLAAAIQRLRRIEVVYEESTDEVRGYLTNAIFAALYLDEHTVTEDELHEPFQGVARTYRPRKTANNKSLGNAEALSLSVVLDPSGVRKPRSSSKPLLAEDTRFELVRACTQPAFQASAIGL